MFNVTVLKIKDVVKYLIELIIFILIIICLYKGISGIKIENNQISKKIIKGNLLECIDTELPVVAEVCKEGEEGKIGIKEEFNLYEDILKRQIVAIESFEEKDINEIQGENEEQTNNNQETAKTEEQNTSQEIAKAATIISCIELSKRMNKKIETLNNLKLTSPDIVFEYFKDKLSDKKNEYFYTLYLDNNKKIISEKLHYIGTINHSLIHPREIYKEAYLCSASSIILIHNHPSGNITPSKEDISITNNLKEIGKLFGIEIVDHIIIGNYNYFSFIENGII